MKLISKILTGNRYGLRKDGYESQRNIFNKIKDIDWIIFHPIDGVYLIYKSRIKDWIKYK